MRQNKSQKDRITRRDFLTGSSLVLTATPPAATLPLLAQQAPASAGPVDPKLIEDLVAANRILYQEGVLDGYGHVSVRHDRDPNRYLLSRALAPELVTAADIIEYDLDSVPARASGREQYSERFIHGEIYKARPDVKSIVHNHSPALIPFSVSSVSLRPIYHLGGFLTGGIPIFEMRKTAGMTDMLIKDAKKGRALAQILGNKPAVLMRGHGASVVGPSLHFAVGRSIYLAMNAKIQAQAIALGGNVTYLDPQEALAVLNDGNNENGGYERPWEMWKRHAMA